MSVRSLLDTNVLVYADAADEAPKQARALEVIREHRSNGHLVLSTQVLHEFVNVALKKLRLPAPLLRQRLAFYGRVELVASSPALIEAALSLHLAHQLPFYDALIVQAAIASGCKQVLSEDLQDGALYGTVRVVNPFKSL